MAKKDENICQKGEKERKIREKGKILRSQKATNSYIMSVRWFSERERDLWEQEQKCFSAKQKQKVKMREGEMEKNNKNRKKQ